VLGEKRERKIKAYKLEPMAQKHHNVKTLVKRIVNNRRDKAHSGTHYSYRYGDNRSLENNRVSSFHIEHFRGYLKRKRTSDKHLERIGKREFHEHNRPYRQHSTEHHNSALLIYGGKDTARVVNDTECIAVEDKRL
jgi:hypothetical protein